MPAPGVRNKPRLTDGLYRSIAVVAPEARLMMPSHTMQLGMPVKDHRLQIVRLVVPMDNGRMLLPVCRPGHVRVLLRDHCCGQHAARRDGRRQSTNEPQGHQ